METRAPFIIVGAFVLAAIGAVFGFVYWLHNTAGTGARTVHHVQFEGSVSGTAGWRRGAVQWNPRRRGHRSWAWSPTARGGLMRPSPWHRPRRCMPTQRLGWISRA